MGEPFEIKVLLSYEELPSENKKGMVLRSKLKKKKQLKAIKAAKQTKKGGKSPAKAPKVGKNKKNKKKRGKKKKSTVEVSTNYEEVLEDPKELDETYRALAEKVLAKLAEEGKEISKVKRATKLEAKMESILESGCDTFYLVDITTVILKYKYFKQYMPRVEPFYAVKCNPDPYLISTLVACGAGLDVASMPEMQKALNAKQIPDKMIFANPCKMGEHIRFAASNGVTKMTFDNAAELRKVAKFHPEAQMVLRILADDSHSTMRFGSKFGANVNTEVEPLLTLAYELGLNVIGVSFHVGSGCQSGEAYRNSLLLARKVFDVAEGLGHPMTFLDIGGGFLGTDTETVIFSDIATSITASLDELFPSPDVRIIAEPGRYFASECVVLVTTVIARRVRAHADPETGEERNMWITTSLMVCMVLSTTCSSTIIALILMRWGRLAILLSARNRPLSRPRRHHLQVLYVARFLLPQWAHPSLSIVLLCSAPLAILLTWCAKMWNFLTWKLVTMYISSIWVPTPRLPRVALMASILPSHITSSLKWDEAD